MSCGAAVRVKPNARLCERWVTHENLSGAAEQRLTELGHKAKSYKNSVAAPRLRNYGDCLPKARRLALGLTLAAAPQLDCTTDASRYRLICYLQTFIDNRKGLAQLILSDAQRWIRKERVPTHEGVEPVLAEMSAKRLHLWRSAVERRHRL